MKHHAEVRYPAPAATVLRMFTDPAFHTRKLEVMGLVKSRVLEQQDRGDDFMIRIERKIPIQIPGSKKSAGDSTVAHTERWNRRSGEGSITAEAAGMPLEMSCVASVTDEGRQGCVARYDWTVTSKVPLVGKTIEKFVVTDLDRRFDEESKVAVSLLDDYR